MSNDPKTETEVEKIAEKVEKATDSIFDDGEYDDGTKSIIGLEGDGDIFWVIQSFFWGIIKVVAVLGILFLLLWLIWKPSDSDFEMSNISEITKNINIPDLKSTQNDEVKTEPKSNIETENEMPLITIKKEKEKTGFMKMIDGIKGIFSSESSKKETDTTEIPKNKPKPKSIFLSLRSATINSQSVESISFELEKKRISYQEDVFYQSVVWLKNAKNLGEISPKLLRITHPVKRAQKIESALRQADNLFKESRFLQKQLQGEINELLKLGQNANETVGRIEENISKSLQHFSPDELATMLQQKIVIQKTAVEYLSKAKLRNTLLQNIRTFDGLLRKKSVPLLRPAMAVPAKNK